MTESLSVHTRDATSADVAFLSDCYRLHLALTKDERGGYLDSQVEGRAEPEEGFRRSIAGELSQVLIGELDGVPVGYMEITETRLPDGSSIGTIESIWVHPKARGVGVGAALMARAFRFAEDRGCTGLDSRALPGDRTTKNFFESNGLVARAIYVHRPLV